MSGSKVGGHERRRVQPDLLDQGRCLISSRDMKAARLKPLCSQYLQAG